MIKAIETRDPNSCLNKAGDGEMLFVLTAHDITAPDTIRDWCVRRVKAGKNRISDSQIQEAYECADTMERQYHINQYNIRKLV